MKLLLLLAVPVLAHCKALQNRIVNGIDADIHDFPFVVSIQKCLPLCEHKCTGSIIGKNTVLTAARCVTDLSKNTLKTLRVRAGSASTVNTSSDANLQIINISHVNFPKDYALWNFTKIVDGSVFHPYFGNDYDIAVLTMEKNFNFSKPNVKPVNMVPSDYSFSDNRKANVSGWGATDGFNSKNTNTLKYASVTSTNYSECNGANSNQICTFESGTGLCPKDLGSPLTVSEQRNGVYLVRVVGIYSHTVNEKDNVCGQKSDTFTSVAKMRQFIDENRPAEEINEAKKQFQKNKNYYYYHHD